MVVRQAVNLVTKSDPVKRFTSATPIGRDLVRRFVAGERLGDGVRVAGELAATGLRCSLRYLGPPVVDELQASEVVEQYRRLTAALEDADLTDRAELSIRLGALGSKIEIANHDGIARDNARLVCETAAKAGMDVTVDAEEADAVDTMFETVSALREAFPSLGATVQANLKRAERDCHDLARPGSRVRLCKGAYGAGDDAYQTRQEVDLSFVRCLRILLASEASVMIATHDPRMIEIAQAIAVRSDRDRNSYEIQMLYGVRPEEQRRLAAQGERVRIYTPYGPAWYPWVVRRVAEHPMNLMLPIRSLTRPV